MGGWGVGGAGRRQALPPDSPALRAAEALRFLNSIISRNPLISLRVFLPEATSSTSFHSFSDSFSRESPVHDSARVKSIQWRLRSYKAVLDESLMHGWQCPADSPCRW